MSVVELGWLFVVLSVLGAGFFNVEAGWRHRDLFEGK